MKKESILAVLDYFGKIIALLLMMLPLIIFSGCDFFPPKADPQPPDPPPAPKPLSIEDIVKKAGPSVVNIYSNESLGSGVIYKIKDGYGYIITNDHVVKKYISFIVRLSDKRTLEGKKIGADPRMDIAVIKVEEDNIQVAEFADSSQVKNGIEAIAIGNAHGSENSVTSGLISNANVNTSDANNKNINKYLQTSAAINPGNSGGALLNKQGQVIGINDMILKNSDNMGFAIPINEAKKIADQLIDKGYVSYPYLGVDTVVQSAKNGESLIVINKVFKDSPAGKEGLRIGDIIYKVDGARVENVAELREQLNNKGIGSMVSIYILRNTKQGFQEDAKTIKLEELPKGSNSDVDWS